LEDFSFESPAKRAKVVKVIDDEPLFKLPVNHKEEKECEAEVKGKPEVHAQDDSREDDNLDALRAKFVGEVDLPESTYTFTPSFLTRV